MPKTPQPVDTGIVPGMVFLGKYRVDAILGQGGMGVVAACTHLALNEKVAIKMLRSDVLVDRDAVERFMREAQAAVKLRSEYVARVSDVGTFENNTPYMVMEFLDGHDLGEVLEQRGCLPYPWATEMVLQACEALAEAHSIGIVHRDVKPTNLFVTWRPDGSALIKVLDFGISKAPMGTDMQLTQTQSLLGTPAYMSPEQMRSARMVDARTDIWSLGTVMYELLEGRRPFEAESFSEMCVKVAVDAPMPMQNAPPQLQHVVFRCLAKSPEQRYANMAELGRDLVPFAQDTQQAQMLVDRMTRTIGRRAHAATGSGEWDMTTNSGVRSQPGLKPIADFKSGPIRTPVPQWHGGSDPAGQAFILPTPASGVVQAVRGREASTPVYLPTEISPPPKRRGAWIFVALAVLAGVGVGFAIALTSGDRSAASVVDPVAEPSSPQPSPSTTSSTPSTPSAPTPPATAATPEGSAAPVEKAGDPRDGKPEPAGEKPKSAVVKKPGPRPTIITPRTPPTDSLRSSIKKDAKEPKEPKEPKEVEKPKSSFDPFSAPRKPGDREKK